jgi:predicted DNA-binding transcriptional regulator AlpA
MGHAIYHPSPLDLSALKSGALLTVYDMAAIVKASTSTVWRMARDGRLPAPVHLGPGMTRWLPADVHDWYAKLGAE